MNSDNPTPIDPDPVASPTRRDGMTIAPDPVKVLEAEVDLEILKSVHKLALDMVEDHLKNAFESMREAIQEVGSESRALSILQFHEDVRCLHEDLCRQEVGSVPEFVHAREPGVAGVHSSVWHRRVHAPR